VTMSGKIDVLAVMDASRRTIAAQSKLSDDVMAHLADDAAKARVAVADLLAADKEYDDAINNLSALNRSIAEFGWIEVEHDALRQASHRLVRARMRRWDALAKAGGAA